MAGFPEKRTLGVDPQETGLEDGTLIRQRTAPPGPIGVEKAERGPYRKPRRRKHGEPPQLHRGKRGVAVKRLQRLLNTRIVPRPNLRVDGVFGPRTYAATRVFQKGRTIKIDGIVGRVTWAHLLGGRTVEVPKAPIKGLTNPEIEIDLVAIPLAPVPPPERLTVWDWPVEKKMLAVIERLPNRLPDRAAEEFRALAEPETLAIVLVLIGLFALLSGGTALVVGAIALGVDVVMAIAAACQITINAANQNELDDAADELAHAVIALGVAVFLAAVARMATGLRSASKGKGLAPTEPSPPTAMKPKPVKKPPKKPPASKGPPPSNPILERLRGLSRDKLLAEIRRATDDPDIVLWEQVPYGEIYTPVRAGPQAAKALGVRPGDVIGYIAESKPAGASSIFGMENAILQNVAPYFDPFFVP